LSDLRTDEDLKLKLIKLVSVDGCSVASAARQLNISTRTAQEFYAGANQWSKLWWENYEKELEYYSGFGYDKPEVIIGFEEPLKMRPPVDREVYKKDKGSEDNSRILVISDLHFPYQHKDVFKFLQYLKDKYNPTRIICTGDEMDGHALSFHDSDPDLPSAGDELKKALPFVQELYKMFPKMDILDSNHGSLVYRKAKHHGVPRHYIKGYNEILGVGEGWKWSFDLTIDLPNGTKCYFHHGKSPDVVKLSQVMGMSAVQGHYHSVFKVDYWANPAGLYFGMQTACLVDRDAYAFAYENSNLKKPIIGTGLIINSHPILEPLLMDEKGNWVGV
jgi:hypothetical protein